MTENAKKQIKELLKSVIERKVNEYEAETEYKPFFEALFEKKDIQIGAIVQSLYTTFGMSVYEQISVILAEDAGFKAQRQYTLLGSIDSDTENFIDTYWNNLKTSLKINSGMKSDKNNEIQLIKKSIKPGTAEKDGDSTVDVFITDKNGKEYYIDISTVKNNLKGFEVLKLKMLRWVGLRLSTNPNADVGTYIAIPYNPYYPNDYMDSRWNTSILDGTNDILVQEDYWNLVGDNPNTYTELLEVFKEVGQEMKNTISKLFD